MDTEDENNNNNDNKKKHDIVKMSLNKTKMRNMNMKRTMDII